MSPHQCKGGQPSPKQRVQHLSQNRSISLSLSLFTRWEAQGASKGFFFLLRAYGAGQAPPRSKWPPIFWEGVLSLAWLLACKAFGLGVPGPFALRSRATPSENPHSLSRPLSLSCLLACWAFGVWERPQPLRASATPSSCVFAVTPLSLSPLLLRFRAATGFGQKDRCVSQTDRTNLSLSLPAKKSKHCLRFFDRSSYRSDLQRTSDWSTRMGADRASGSCERLRSSKAFENNL